MRFLFLSLDADPRFRAALRSTLPQPGSLIEIPRMDSVYPAIASHPDIFLCPLPGKVIAAPGLVPLLKKRLEAAGAPGELLSQVLAGETEPGAQYPESARYNALTVGRFFFHNPKLTDPFLRSQAEASGLTLVPVKQGYARCAAVAAGSRALITADGGIARAAEAVGLEVLRIQPGHVELAGFPYGFLGGTCGQAGGELWFHGDLSRHPDGSAIQDFLTARGLVPRYIPGLPLTDIGSLLALGPPGIS